MAYERYIATMKKGRGAAKFDQARYPGFAYKRTGKYAYHWEATLGADELREAAKLAKQDGFVLRATPIEYTRSSGYRKEFLAADPGPHRCRYCRRKLDDNTLTVDHLVSVGSAKQSWFARWMLRAAGAANVNDVKNLVPACGRCNRRKAAKGGLWILRGVLGRYRAYWVALRFAQTALIAIALFGIWMVYHCVCPYYEPVQGSIGWAADVVLWDAIFGGVS